MIKGCVDEMMWLQSEIVWNMSQWLSETLYTTTTPQGQGEKDFILYFSSRCLAKSLPSAATQNI